MAGPLTYAQLEGLWIRAGGPPSQAPTAAAIALAESNGDPGAVNPSDNNGTQTSWGAWQISNGTHSEPSPRWRVPIVNARLAVAKYKGAGNSFSPWGTFNSGAYKKYVNAGTTPDFTASGAASAQIGGNASSGADPGCLAGFTAPGISLPLVGNVAGGGQICIIRKSQARAWLGGLLIGAGGVVLFGSFAILVGTGLSRTRAVGQAATAAGYVAAPVRAARGVANRRVTREQGAQRQAASEERAAARAQPRPARQTKADRQNADNARAGRAPNSRPVSTAKRPRKRTTRADVAKAS